MQVNTARQTRAGLLGQEKTDGPAQVSSREHKHAGTVRDELDSRGVDGTRRETHRSGCTTSATRDHCSAAACRGRGERSRRLKVRAAVRGEHERVERNNTGEQRSHTQQEVDPDEQRQHGEASVRGELIAALLANPWRTPPTEMAARTDGYDSTHEPEQLSHS